MFRVHTLDGQTQEIERLDMTKANNARQRGTHGVSLLSVLALLSLAVPSYGQWPQFGGPGRNFHAATTGLSTDWPEAGPAKLWMRKLGDGYSGVVVADGTIYTMYRKGDRESVIAMDAGSGETTWELVYAANLSSKMDKSFGSGPRSTPAIAGDRLFTVGIMGMLNCIDRASGKVVWSHDLMKEYQATQLYWGYSSSPLVHENLVIVPVGSTGRGIVAFNQSDGSVVWKTGSDPNAYSSPTLLTIDGATQIVSVHARGLTGLNPADGKVLWRFKHKTDYDVNAAIPVVYDGNSLFYASAYGTGSRALKIDTSGQRVKATQLWKQRKMNLHFGSAIELDGHVYGSSGDNGPVFFACVNLTDGSIVFKDRNIGKSQLLLADGKLIMLDEDGNLAIATATPEGVTVHAKAKILERVAWTSPTLVDKTLYVRDKKVIMALTLP